MSRGWTTLEEYEGILSILKCIAEWRFDKKEDVSPLCLINASNSLFFLEHTIDSIVEEERWHLS